MKIMTLDKHPNGIDFIYVNKPNLYSYIKKIQSLNDFDKIKIYIHYYINQISLKNNFIVVDILKENSQKGLSVPDKTFKNISFYYLWKENKIYTFDEFYSDSNIEIRDCGEDWEEKGFAQRWWIQCFGVYDWFSRFEEEFNF